jgi:hypothetical protein
VALSCFSLVGSERSAKRRHMIGLGLAGLSVDVIIWTIGLSGLIANLLIIIFTVGCLGVCVFRQAHGLPGICLCFPLLFVRCETVTVVYR